MTDFSEQVVKKTLIDDLYIIERPVFKDDRGLFKEVVRFGSLSKDINFDFKPSQWSHSISKKGVLRGIHAESWNKIVYPVTGKVFLAQVDIRPESRTFGKYETLISDEDNRFALYVTKGIANSFCVMGEEDVHYLYVVDGSYDGSDTKAIAWDDPDVAVPWPVKNPIISDRDKGNPRLRDMFPDKFTPTPKG